MALVVPDKGERALLDMMLKDAAPNPSNLRLFSAVAGAAIVEATVEGDFTEANFTGYAAKALARATWGAAATAGGVSSSTYAQQSWLPTTAQTVLGYYVTENTAGDIMWGELFAAGRALQNGDTLSVTPYIELA